MATLRNLEYALVKLERSIETGIDPISGFTTVDILEWLEENQPLEPDLGTDWERMAKAAIRRLLIKAEQVKLRNRQIRDLRRALRNQS